MSTPRVRIVSEDFTRPAGLHIRWMIRRDMPEVLAIENASHEFPWSEDEFIRCLRDRNCIGMVAEINDKVVGFMLYNLHLRHLEILNFTVHEDFRRVNVGRSMLAKLYSKLSPQRRKLIRVHVRESNLGALNFFKACGYRAAKIERDYYRDCSDDAILMQIRYRSDYSQSSLIEESGDCE